MPRLACLGLPDLARPQRSKPDLACLSVPHQRKDAFPPTSLACLGPPILSVPRHTYPRRPLHTMERQASPLRVMPATTRLSAPRQSWPAVQVPTSARLAAPYHSRPAFPCQLPSRARQEPARASSSCRFGFLPRRRGLELLHHEVDRLVVCASMAQRSFVPAEPGS